MSWQLSIFEVGVIPGVPLHTYLPDAPRDALIDPPCFCYLATDGSRAVLIDSGPDRARSAEAGLQIVGDTTALLTTGLNAHGLAPQDIDLIVHTHLHYDHMLNDLLFPSAIVIVQRAELAWATTAGSGPFYVGVGDLARELGDRLRLLDGQAEVLPGLTALPNGGHTPGHQSVLVHAADHTVCVCGDIVSLEENLNVIGPVCPDASATEAFLRKARGVDWVMLPGHDPRLRQHRWYVPTADPAVHDPDRPRAARGPDTCYAADQSWS